MAHEDYKEMLPAQALSALDAVDARALHQHLTECDECRRELADWENTAAALALSPNPAEPSRHVRERIMSAVRNEKRGQRSESRIVSFPQSRRDVWRSFGLTGAIAASVLLLFLIIWIVVLWQQNRELRRQMDLIAGDFEALREEAGRSNEFVNILNSDGARVAKLSGTGPAPDATAQLVYDRSGRAMLMANNLPPTPEGKAYQLWFIVGRNPPIPGRTFTANFAGRGELSDDIPEQALDSAVFAVTLERAGGATAPTSPLYLRSGL